MLRASPRSCAAHSGSLDATFGNGGTLLPGSSGTPALQVLHDGSILAARHVSTDDVISRFTPAGALDPTFGGAGTGTAAVAFTGSNGAPVMSAFEGATPAADVARKSRQAASIATDLEQLLAERRARGAKHAKEPAEARDRDATLVNQLLREIRAAGVYAFRDDPARQALLPQRGRRAEAGASEAEDGGGRERRDGACKRRRGPQLTRF